MKRLRIVLLANATSCLGFGVLFLSLGDRVNQFIGNHYPWAIAACGIVLLAYGAHLVIASNRRRAVKLELAYFIIGDYLWVVGTIALSALGLVITTDHGIIAALAIAVVVAIFGTLQLCAFRDLSSGKDTANAYRTPSG